jgi:hypothetical protein
MDRLLRAAVQPGSSFAMGTFSPIILPGLAAR